MIKKRVVVNIFLLISLMVFVSASFEIGEESHSVSATYGPGDNVTGWINLSLNSEPTNSVFSDSLGNSISLIDLIRKNENFDYNCSTVDCVSDYSANNGEETKSFDLNERQSKIIGLEFSGEITSIDSIDFILDSDASSDCYNQIKLDFLNDGAIEKGNNKISGSSCSFLRSYGCFNETENLYYPAITAVPYCERVNVFETPGLKLGAWVREETAGDKGLTMALYDMSGSLKTSCALNKQGIANGSEIYCNVDYSITNPGDYYVCIYSDSGTGTYKTKGYSGNSNCGFSGFPVNQETNSYQIFAEGKAFGIVGILNISNSLSNGNTLSGIVSNYILDTYGSFDCSQGCIVPIKLISGKDQHITLKGLKVVYNKPGLTGITETNFYDLNEIPSVVNADFQKLSLDEGGFTLPEDYGSQDFELSLNDETIFKEHLSIEKVPVIESITPASTASAYPTLFKAKVSSNNSLTEYRWEFGDNNIQTTTTNQVTHTYASSGKYAFKLTVTDSLGRSVFKKMDISVGSPKEIINSTLLKKLKDLDNVNLQMGQFDSFTQKNLDSILDTETLNEELKKIRKDYNAAFSEDEYNQALTDLLALDVPEAIMITKTANSISFPPKKDYIDLYALETIGGGNYDVSDEDKYINAILSWNQANFETKISFKEISAEYPSSTKPVLRIFELSLNAKNSLTSNPYFILRNLDDLNFKENYLENEESGYTYIELKKDEAITFSTTEDVDFMTLPFFVSPAISKLSIGTITSVDDEKSFSNWILFISIVVLLALIGVITYIVLQVWYKNKYESHLFKNRNNLYNLITYVNNARKRGLSDREISSKLRKAGWNSEQVAYAIKKHAGRRTGMLELPVGKIIKIFKKKDASQDRTPPGRKFIR